MNTETKLNPNPPTHYTKVEGGRWYKMPKDPSTSFVLERMKLWSVCDKGLEGKIVPFPDTYKPNQIHAMRFKDGTRWDCVNGVTGKIPYPRQPRSALQNAVSVRNFRKGRLAYITNNLKQLINECKSDGAAGTNLTLAQFDCGVKFLEIDINEAYLRQRKQHPPKKTNK